jgi:hypothetical protein
MNAPVKRHGNYGAVRPQSVLAARNGTQPQQESRYLRSDAWKALPGSQPVPLDLRTGCHWPLGDRHPFDFCNQEISTGVYCAQHNAISRADRSKL